MGCCHSILTRRKIKIEGEGLIDDELIDSIILKTNFEEEEILNLLIEFIKLEPNENGLISNYQFLQMPNIKYSPFGYHLLEVFEMNGKQAEKDLEKGIYKFDNVRRISDKNKEKEDKKSEEDDKKNEDENDEDKKKKKKDDEDENDEDKKKKKKDDEDEDEEDKKKKKKDDEDENDEDKKKKKKDDEDEDDKKKSDKKEEVEIPLDIPDKFKKYDLTAETKLLKKLYEKNGDTIQYINFKKFCEILYYFSSHVKVDEKSRIFFKLFDFDKDGRIGIKDIKTYLDNLNRPAKEILAPIEQDDPEDSKKEISIISESNNDEDSEEEKNKKKNKKKKNKKENETEKEKNTNNNKNNNDTNNNENEVLELEQLQKEDKSTQIANVIIKEATNNNKEFLDFFDFRYLFLNTQFIPDYQHNLYLYEELPNEKELHILKSN